MTCYRVIWEIDIEADNPRQAAENALAIQRDPKSTATIFYIEKNIDGRIERTMVDLMLEDGEERL